MSRTKVTVEAIAMIPVWVKESIMKALENPKYNWRTINGIVDETSLPVDMIESVLYKLENEGVIVSQLDAEGHAIFTTWNHYKKSQGFLNRLLTTISGRIK